MANRNSVPTAVGAEGVTPQQAADAELKEQKQAGAVIEVPANESPVAEAADAADKVAHLEAKLQEMTDKLARAQAELTAARGSGDGLVEVELESGAPKWVQAVSGMERKDIMGYTVLPGAQGDVLVVKDRDGREGHRFTIPEIYRAASRA